MTGLNIKYSKRLIPLKRMVEEAQADYNFNERKRTLAEAREIISAAPQGGLTINYVSQKFAPSRRTLDWLMNKHQGLRGNIETAIAEHNSVLEG
jgi:hypothetical protein